MTFLCWGFFVKDVTLVLIGGAVFFIVVDLFFNFLRVLRLVRDWRIIFFLPLGSGTSSITDCLLGCGGWEVRLDVCACVRLFQRICLLLSRRVVVQVG